jgi:hypothetical protein
LGAGALFRAFTVVWRVETLPVRELTLLWREVTLLPIAESDCERASIADCCAARSSWIVESASPKSIKERCSSDGLERSRASLRESSKVWIATAEFFIKRSIGQRE